MSCHESGTGRFMISSFFSWKGHPNPHYSLFQTKAFSLSESVQVVRSSGGKLHWRRKGWKGKCIPQFPEARKVLQNLTKSHSFKQLSPNCVTQHAMLWLLDQLFNLLHFSTNNWVLKFDLSKLCKAPYIFFFSGSATRPTNFQTFQTVFRRKMHLLLKRSGEGELRALNGKEEVR